MSKKPKPTLQLGECEVVSPCCKATIRASLGDGILLGSCEACGQTVCRTNPRTYRNEWRNGADPWTNDDAEETERNPNTSEEWSSPYRVHLFVSWSRTGEKMTCGANQEHTINPGDYILRRIFSGRTDGQPIPEENYEFVLCTVCGLPVMTALNVAAGLT